MLLRQTRELDPTKLVQDKPDLWNTNRAR
jgi:hypothetical protein